MLGQQQRDEENQDFFGDKYLSQVDAEVRAGFMRKVYGILCAQLALTAVVSAVFCVALPPDFVQANPWLMNVSLGMTLVTILAMSCCSNVARTAPGNYICLFVFTFFESILVGAITAQYQTQSVLLAFALTASIVFSLTLYACLTKSDFTGFGPYLFVALVSMFLFGLILSFTGGSEMTNNLYAGMGACLFSFYIVYDTQLIVGGKHKKHQFGVDDYVFAALNIYLDIINLFLYLIELFGERK